MMENFEEQMQKKLREMEYEPATDAWERISGAMPSRHHSHAFVWWTVGGIAAGLTLLFAVGGEMLAPVSDSITVQHVSLPIESLKGEERIAPMSAAPMLKETLTEELKRPQLVNIQQRQPLHRVVMDGLVPLTVETPTLYAAVPVVDICLTFSRHQSSESPRFAFLKGWHVGMGAASVGVTSTDVGMQNIEYNNSVIYMDPMDYGEMGFQRIEDELFHPSSLKTAPVDAKHSSPCLFSVSFYRSLIGKFSFSTGVVYSQLVSRWNLNSSKSVQRIHLLGIPLSVNYQIGSVGAFRVYASAGTEMDVNVSGQVKITDYKGSVQKQRLRSKNLLWTLRGRFGVAYPLCRWAAVYGECGVDRYLNAPSGLNTFRSEKKTRYVGQVGVSIGF